MIIPEWFLVIWGAYGFVISALLFGSGVRAKRLNEHVTKVEETLEHYRARLDRAERHSTDINVAAYKLAKENLRLKKSIQTFYDLKKASDQNFVEQIRVMNLEMKSRQDKKGANYWWAKCLGFSF